MHKIKSSSIIILIVYLFQFLITQIVYGAMNFELQSFSIIVNSGGATAGNVNTKPGDILKIAVGGENKGDTLTNLKSAFTFGSTDFTYYQPGTIDSYVWWSPDKSNISTSLFNPPTLNYCPVADTSNNGDVHDLYYLQMQLNQTISSYNFNITNQFTADGYVGSNQITRTIYVDVKPHITDYYFEKNGSTINSIKNDGADSIDLILKVKDYNGCTNIDGATVRSNLSTLGLNSSESLNYVSCDTNTNTATYKKSGITTLVGTGNITFNYSKFTAIDENSNQNDPTDSRFNSIDKISDLNLTVQAPGSPSVILGNLDDNYIGSASQTSSNFAFSGNQNGNYKIVANGNSTCSAGTTIVDWTTYTSGSNISTTINSSSLNVGSNTIFVCIKNSSNQIGASSTTITKDIVTPAISIFTISPSNVTTANSNIEFSCSENGLYKVCKGSNCTTTISDRSNISANISTSVVIPNATLSLGSNSIYLWCQDNAGNLVENSGTITKTESPPSMSGGILSFSDNDIDFDGLDGRDFLLTWNATSGINYTSFESWRIYILPDGTALNTSNHTYSELITNKNTTSWSGSSSLIKDSAGNNFVNGTSYKAYIQIMSNAGELGTAGNSQSVVFYADTVQHPVISSAKFTASNILQLTTNATLDTNLGSHDASKISYKIGSTTFTGSGISSISSNKINITISNLSSLSATGNTLIINTGAIHSDGGGYNNYFSSGSLIITDGQSPTISSFSKTTTPTYGNFYKGNFGLTYIFSENMKSGNTRIEITRSSGNTDGNQHNIGLFTTDLTAGTKNKTINLDSQSLVCGTTYQYRIYGEDNGGNVTTTSYLTGLTYDNCGPSAPNLTDYSTFGTGNITLDWSNSTDDGGYGAGIKNYTLKFYNGTGCSSINNTYTNILSNSKSINSLANGNYSWKIIPYDNLSNTGTISSCDYFTIDTTIPTITNLAILDSTLGLTQYTKSGDNISVSANISNTNSNNIYLNMSALVGGGTTYNNVLCSSTGSPSISCNYAGGIVTYNFPSAFAGTITDGVKQLILTSNNTNGFNQQTSNTSITYDNTPPTVNSSTFTYPIGGESLGGTQTISWDQTKITDNLGISYIRLEYSTGTHTNWHIIMTGANNGSYSWNLNSLESRSDYRLRIIAYDNVLNNSNDTTDSNFTIDLNGPTVPTNTITYPNGNTILKGGSITNITWNNAGITDLGGLATNPIDLYYSIDGGTNWTLIASGLPNNGSYSRTPPTINNTTTKIRLIAYDSSGNYGIDSSDSNSIIDSTNPTLTMTYTTNGGTTPVNGSKLSANNSFDSSLTTNDTYLDKIYYQFTNTTDSLYWNSGLNLWTGTNSWNLVCTDNVALGNGGNCSNISTGINATIINQKNYRLKYKAIDEAGNTFTGTNIDYVGDTILPTSTILITSGSYFSGTTTISGTGSDVGAGISQILLQIKKGTDYWNGSSFQGSSYRLNTSTSNSYANWTYSFVIPSGDTDGQEYIVTSRIIDKSYKTGNESYTSKTIKKDFTAPNIVGGSGIFSSPTLNSKHIGGGTINIVWNSGTISDTTSGLKNNGIKLEYWNGSIWTTISTNEANDGNYTWSNIPALDYNLVKIRIVAYDNARNYTTQESSTFEIDSTPPSIQSIETMENSITNGKINALKITMSEDILDSSININDFSISNNIGTPTSKETGASADDNIFILNFSQTGNTATTPSLSYTKGSLVDLAGKNLESVSNILSSDKVGPRILTGGIYDTNLDGKIDKISISFSENLSNTTNTNAWSINNPVGGSSLQSAGVSTNIANLTLNQGNFDTSTGGMYIDFTTNSNWKDSSNNQASSYSNLTLLDLAKPIFVNSEYLDTNGNYKLDSIKIYLSEITTGFDGNNFSFNGFSTGSSISTSNKSNSILTFGVNETSENNDTNIGLTMDFTSGNLKDISSNYSDGKTSFVINDKISPKPLTYETKDIDGNGKIDRIKITFSENLNHSYSSFVGTVNSYSITGYTGSTNSTYLLVNEKTTFDTDNTPSIQFISNSSLSDISNNLVLQQGSANSSQDKVGPVIAGARYDESTNKIYITFSENIDTNTLDLTNASNDFVVSGGGSLGTNSTVSISDNKNITITLGDTATNLTQGISKIGIKTGAINDQNTNPAPTQGTQNQIVVSASVIINEIMWSNSGTNNQYIELRNLSSNSADISNWIIENAGGNGINITIPASTNIAGNGYYLIAKIAQTSSLLNIAPDNIDSTLNLNPSGQSNLILKNGSLVQDTVISTTWPAGNLNPLKSMERLNGCGDGTSNSCWYTAQDSIGFDNSNIYGTPKSINKFDAIPPSLSVTNIAQDSLIPAGGFNLQFDYADNSTGVGVDISSEDIVFSKRNNGSSNWIDYTTTGLNITSKNITTSSATYPIKNIGYGKYKAHFEISDLASNILSYDLIFYIDDLSIDFQNNNMLLPNIATSIDYITGETIITIKTLGAGVEYNISKDLWNGPTNLVDRDGNYGFGFDLYKNINGTITNFDNSYSQIVGTTNIDDINYSIDTNGLQKTYIYKFKYKVRVDNIQSAGIYSNQILNSFKFSY